MKVVKKINVSCITGLSMAFIASSGMAASTQVTMTALTNGIKDNTGTLLSSGVDTVNGDGVVFELGYFTVDTNTFSGSWVSLTGPNSNNVLYVTTIGDLTGQDGSMPVPDGLFSIEVVFEDTDNDLPAGGTQLAVRFYDALTTETSSNYNTATNSAWTFSAPADVPPVALVDFDSVSAAPVWEDSANPFETSITIVPEPSSFALLGLGGLGFLLRRRR